MRIFAFINRQRWLIASLAWILLASCVASTEITPPRAEATKTTTTTIEIGAAK